MARAYGSNASLLLKRESAYGQQATGNYYQMPFNSSELGSEQGLIEDAVLGYGRDPLQPPAMSQRLALLIFPLFHLKTTPSL